MQLKLCKFIMLTATVYCNCIESNSLQQQPNPNWQIIIYADGMVKASCHNTDQVADLTHWWNNICEHEDRILLSLIIGNTSTISIIRHELSHYPHLYPIILKKVVYNGVHGGDYLTVAQIKNLQAEITALSKFQDQYKNNQNYINTFTNTMKRLITAALSVNKPILF